MDQETLVAKQLEDHKFHLITLFENNSDSNSIRLFRTAIKRIIKTITIN